MSKEKHSALPFCSAYGGWSPWEGAIEICTESLETIAWTPSGSNEKANAAFIVEACNSYYDNKREIERLTAENNELRTGEYLVKVIEERERLRKELENANACLALIRYAMQTKVVEINE